MRFSGASKRLFFTIVCASLLTAANSVQFWDWNSAWGGKSVKGSGVIKTETRNVSGFNRISVAIPGKVDVVQGNTESVSVESDDNIVPFKNRSPQISRNKQNWIFGIGDRFV